MNADEETIRLSHNCLFGESRDRVIYEEVEVDSRVKGAIAELQVSKRAMEKGFCVSKPMIDGCRYDLIIEENGRLKKVQVKYSSCLSKNENTILFSLCRKNKAGQKLKYSKNDVDIFMLYSPISEKIYRVENNGDMGHVSIVLNKISEYSKSSFLAEEVEF